MSRKKQETSKTKRIEVRLSSDLKQALEQYSAQNLESIMMTADQALKRFVGFGMDSPPVQVLSKEDDLPKKERLEVRVYPQIWHMLLAAQDRHREGKMGKKPKMTAVILSAIMQYIGYTEESLAGKHTVHDTEKKYSHSKTS